jgi:hypothetical protein
VLVEQAPQLRSGGYIIDFWRLGYGIAGNMALIPRIRERCPAAQVKRAPVVLQLARNIDAPMEEHMGVAVERYFDSGSEQLVHQLQARLTSHGIPPTLEQLGFRPHISLAAFA